MHLYICVGDMYTYAAGIYSIVMRSTRAMAGNKTSSMPRGYRRVTDKKEERRIVLYFLSFYQMIIPKERKKSIDLMLELGRKRLSTALLFELANIE